MASESFQYHIAEYNKLKDELAQTFKEAYQIILVSVTANAAIISFLSTDFGNISIPSIANISNLMPLFVSLVASALLYLRRRSISKITTYLYVLEERFALEGLGWERFYAKDIQARPDLVRTPTLQWAVMGLQVLLGAAFPFMVNAVHP